MDKVCDSPTPTPHTGNDILGVSRALFSPISYDSCAVSHKMFARTPAGANCREIICSRDVDQFGRVINNGPVFRVSCEEGAWSCIFASPTDLFGFRECVRGKYIETQPFILLLRTNLTNLCKVLIWFVWIYWCVLVSLFETQQIVMHMQRNDACQLRNLR